MLSANTCHPVVNRHYHHFHPQQPSAMDLISQDSEASLDLEHLVPFSQLPPSNRPLSSAFPSPPCLPSRGPWLPLGSTVSTLLIALEELANDLKPAGASPKRDRAPSIHRTISPPALRTPFRSADNGFTSAASTDMGSLRRKRSATEQSPEPNSSNGESKRCPSSKARRLGSGLSTRFSKSLTVDDVSTSSQLPSPFSPTNATSQTLPIHRLQDHEFRKLACPRTRPPVLLRKSSTLSMDTTLSDLYPASFLTTPSADPMDEDDARASPSHNNNDDVEIIGARDAVWTRKKQELEYNLGLLQNGAFGGDSYEDLRAIVEGILETGRWLSGGDLEQLGNLVPMWRLYQDNIGRVLQFISIIEDMRSLLTHTWEMQGDLDDDLLRISTFLDTKSTKYTDILNPTDSSWKHLGFPIDEELLRAVSQWMISLPWRYWLFVETEMTREKREQGKSGKGLVDAVLSGLAVGADFASFTHRPLPPKMDDMAISLVALYLEWATQGLHLLARRASISKTAMLADNAVKALESLRILRMSGVSGRRLASPGRVVKREDGEVERFEKACVEFGIGVLGGAGSAKGRMGGEKVGLVMALGCRFVKGVVALSLPDAVNDGRVTKLCELFEAV